MQCFEIDTIEEEGRDHLSFLATCAVALQACPPETHGVLMGPLQLLTVNILLATLLDIPSQIHSTRERPTPIVSTATTPVLSGPSLGTK